MAFVLYPSCCLGKVWQNQATAAESTMLIVLPTVAMPPRRVRASRAVPDPIQGYAPLSGPPAGQPPAWATSIIQLVKDQRGKTDRALQEVAESRQELRRAKRQREESAPPNIAPVKPSCKRQYAFNQKIMAKLNDIEEAVEEGDEAEQITEMKKVFSQWVIGAPFLRWRTLILCVLHQDCPT